MNLLRLSLNLLRRDWRAGEWRVLLIALVLAVGDILVDALRLSTLRLRHFLGEGSGGFVGWISAAHPPTYS